MCSCSFRIVVFFHKTVLQINSCLLYLHALISRFHIHFSGRIQLIPLVISVLQANEWVAIFNLLTMRDRCKRIRCSAACTYLAIKNRGYFVRKSETIHRRFSNFFFRENYYLKDVLLKGNLNLCVYIFGKNVYK